jgi:hypothetical protein
VNIGVFAVDFAKCPREHYTAIRPSSLLPTENDPQWKARDNPPVVFACNECRRVYSVNKDELEQRPTGMGVGPYNPEAPTTVFQMPIECDDSDCSAQLLVHVWRNSNTTAEQMLEQRKTWLFVGVKCPEGHDFPKQEWK